MSRRLCLLGFGLLLVLAACAPVQRVAPPRAVGGVIDLSTYSWSSGPVALDGEWTFDGKPVTVPSNLSFNGSPYGAGTYRLRLLLPAAGPTLALRLPIVGTAFEIRAGGRLLAREGTVASSEAAAVPSYRPRIVLFPSVASELDLEIAVSNWHDQFAGLYYGVTLGPWDEMQGQRTRAALWEALMFGGIFLLGLYQIANWFFRRCDPAPLWFGIFCALVALRSTFYSEVIFLDAFPDASWFVVIRGVYVTMSLALVAVAVFIHRLYPDVGWRPAVVVAVVAGSVYALINLLAPISWTTGLLVPFQLIMVSYGLYGLVTVLRALKARAPGAGLFVIGLGVFLATMVFDILKSHWFGDIPSLVNVGTLVLLAMQSLVVARQFAASFSMVEKINVSLERFIPREMLGFLNKSSITEIVLGDYSELRMTVFFLDIRDFTSLSETMSPRENFRFINSFLRLFGPLVRDHNGFVDKYLGDGMMALFPGEPDEALKAALAMRAALKDYNTGRERGGYQPIRFGIGVHTGPLMLGTIGENRRMDSTVISDTVNAASRLEGLTKKYLTDILVSGATVAELGRPADFDTEFLAFETVKGKTQPIEVFRVNEAAK
jgi:class 3 adenylate cyclase